MNGWPWLLGAMGAALAAYWIGRPTWIAHRTRARRDLNAERYLTWRGRADRTPAPAQMTAAEGRRAWLAGGLGILALACLAVYLGSG